MKDLTPLQVLNQADKLAAEYLRPGQIFFGATRMAEMLGHERDSLQYDLFVARYLRKIDEAGQPVVRYNTNEIIYFEK